MMIGTTLNKYDRAVHLIRTRLTNYFYMDYFYTTRPESNREDRTVRSEAYKRKLIAYVEITSFTFKKSKEQVIDDVHAGVPDNLRLLDIEWF